MDKDKKIQEPEDNMRYAEKKAVRMMNNGLNNDVPLTRLYPPFISGSKFCNISASPGDIENTSLFNVKPPAQLTTNGDIKSVVGIFIFFSFYR